MIPKFTESGILPQGIHDTTWEEFCDRFGNPSVKRKQLIVKIKVVISILQQAGCMNIYIDGSFVTEILNPNDFDICWSEEGVDLARLNIILRRAPLSSGGKSCKTVYGGDVFPKSRLVPNPNYNSHSDRRSAITFLDFFQIDKATNQPKGIIVIDLNNVKI